MSGAGVNRHREKEDKKISILLLLADEKGHPQREISKHIETAFSNTNSIIRELMEDHLIYEGAPRRTTNPMSKRPRAKEIPLYIIRDLKVYRTILMNINDEIEENILNIHMASRNRELARQHIILERNGLRLKKGSITQEDYENLYKKFDEMAKYRGHEESFYEKKRDKYMAYLEKFLLSKYTEEVIREFGLDAVLRIGLTGTLDIWYMEKIIQIALNKKLADELRIKEILDAMQENGHYELPCIFSRRIPSRFENGTI
ncbi:MAG: hypothetical protein N3G75_02540 [Methanothrix sp.]|nr:hypothetical protein [Methanothrix sp.]MCX8206694.1 hypothetical protein [Methanothrix sp.]